MGWAKWVWRVEPGMSQNYHCLFCLGDALGCGGQQSKT